MEHLSTKAILLDMTTDLSRVGNFTLQGKEKRMLQFLEKLKTAKTVLSNRAIPTKISFFVDRIGDLIQALQQEEIQDKRLLAEDAFTYGNILSRRASKLIS